MKVWVWTEWPLSPLAASRLWNVLRLKTKWSVFLHIAGSFILVNSTRHQSPVWHFRGTEGDRYIPTTISQFWKWQEDKVQFGFRAMRHISDFAIQQVDLVNGYWGTSHFSETERLTMQVCVEVMEDFSSKYDRIAVKSMISTGRWKLKQLLAILVTYLKITYFLSLG